MDLEFAKASFESSVEEENSKRLQDLEFTKAFFDFSVEEDEKQAVEVEHKRLEDLEKQHQYEIEKSELNDIYKRLRDTQHVSQRYDQLNQRNKELLLSLEKTEEVLFYRTDNLCQSSTELILTYVITNKNVYKSDKQNTLSPVLCLMYTFFTVLTKKQIILLENGIATWNSNGDIFSRMSRTSSSRSGYNDFNIYKKFESVVRLIPGSYQNGDWRQLDGFFGMYYNEKTMEVCEFPPQ